MRPGRRASRAARKQGARRSPASMIAHWGRMRVVCANTPQPEALPTRRTERGSAPGLARLGGYTGFSRSCTLLSTISRHLRLFWLTKACMSGSSPCCSQACAARLSCARTCLRPFRARARWRAVPPSRSRSWTARPFCCTPASGSGAASASASCRAPITSRRTTTWCSASWRAPLRCRASSPTSPSSCTTTSTACPFPSKTTTCT